MANNKLGTLVENWKGAINPSLTKLEGQYVSLCPFHLDTHAKPLFACFDRAEDWTYLPYGPFASFENFYAWLELSCTKEDPLFFTVIDHRQNIMGIASYLNIVPEHGSIEIGHIHFSPLMQRSPMSTEAIYLMMAYVFDHLGYRRLEWKCNALNERSRGAAKRFGFTFEGIFRQHFVYKERNRDSAWFSILGKEWSAQKEKFCAWLKPSNFDENGQQYHKL